VATADASGEGGSTKPCKPGAADDEQSMGLGEAAWLKHGEACGDSASTAKELPKQPPRVGCREGVIGGAIRTGPATMPRQDK